METTELPALSFESPAHALAWAEEQQSLPGVKCTLGRFAKRWQRGFAEVRSQRWTPEDYRDLAHTIIACWAQIGDPHAKAALRAIHGCHDPLRHAWLAGELGKSLFAEHPTRSYSRIARLADAAIWRERSRAQQKKALPVSWYARALGIRRQSLDSANWMPVIVSAQKCIHWWMDSAQRSMADSLDQAGIMSREDSEGAASIRGS